MPGSPGPVRATTVTPYPAAVRLWAIFQTRESFWNGLLTMSAAVRTARGAVEPVMRPREARPREARPRDGDTDP